MTRQSCKTVRELLVGYSDGELPEGDAQRVAAHLGECFGCRSELRLLEHSLELARAVWRESAARARACGTCPVDRRPRPIPAAAVLVACVVVLAVAVGTWFFLRGGSRAEVEQLEQIELAGPVEPPKEMEKPAAAPPAEEMDIGTMIARAERAARLAAAAELLATQPGLERYREQTEQYLAKTYRGTPAGDRAAMRSVPLPEKEPES
ncbi:MAG: zf-HC2 domain-containing protein [Planctomycetes bacterium]|nr:zf-HC2 domain-containing protein [Planctomycetota bacterium]